MEIYYGNTQLASSGVDGPSGLSVNGSQIADEVAFFRAAARRFYGRGNKQTEVSFTRFWTFGSLREAEAHVLRHNVELSIEADLLFIVGTPGDTQDCVLANAVLTGCDHDWTGLTVRTTYQFLGGIVETEDVTPPNESDLVKAGTINLSASETSKAVAFDVPFGAAPRGVHVTVLAPTGESGFDVWVDESTRAATGFTAVFGSAVPGAGYKLSWIAVL